MPLVEVLRRYSAQGDVSVLFEVLHGAELWLMKVPRRDLAGAESMSAREWLYNRLAARLGLPVAPIAAVYPFSDRRPPELRGEQDVFTATPLVGLGPAVRTWSELSPRDRAALVFWENATAVGAGDKIRSSGPRDVFHWPASPRSACEGRVLMLDYDSRPAVWDEAAAGRSARGLEIVEDTAVAAAGIPLATLRGAAEAALHVVDDDAWWTETFAEARLFLRREPPDLRSILRARVEQTWAALAGEGARPLSDPTGTGASGRDARGYSSRRA